MNRLWRATLSSIAGLSFAARNEMAFRQEIVVLAASAPLAFFISSNALTRALLIGAVLLVMLAEIVNTAFETLSDHVTPEHSLAIKAVKDLASAAVMIAIAIAGLIWLAAVIQWIER